MTNNRIRDDDRNTSGNAVRKRVPLQQQTVFEAPPREGYTRKWVEVLPGLVERHELAGWTAVLDPTTSTHDNLAQVETQMGSPLIRVVNHDPFARCRENMLMEIPTEWYREDFLAEQNEIKRKEKAFQTNKQNEYGDVKIE